MNKFVYRQLGDIGFAQKGRYQVMDNSGGFIGFVEKETQASGKPWWRGRINAIADFSAFGATRDIVANQLISQRCERSEPTVIIRPPE